MNNRLTRLTPLFSGALFGFGMAFSGMIDPAKVIGFLDFAGQWDPSLAFVMGGALLVFLPSYHLLIKPRSQSINGENLCLPASQHLDSRLMSGAAVFGIGWGLAGVCPGPAVTSVALGSIEVVLFLVAMLVGSLMANVAFPKAQLAREFAEAIK